MAEYVSSSMDTDGGITIDIREYPANTNADAAPVKGVLLVGWFMASKKHMRSYIDVYSYLGFNTFCVVLPIASLAAYTESRIHGYAQSILSSLSKRADLFPGGLVVHTFSNGGSILMPTLASMRAKAVYGSTEKALKKGSIGQVLESICGTVFECAPCYMDYEKLELSATSSVGSNPVYIIIAKLLTFFVNLRLSIVYGNFPRQDHWDGFWDLFQAANYHYPEFYVYSTKDRILNQKKLEQLIKYRETTHGKSISKYRVDNSAHVKIIRDNKSEYTKAIKSFLDSLWDL